MELTRNAPSRRRPIFSAADAVSRYTLFFFVAVWIVSWRQLASSGIKLTFLPPFGRVSTLMSPLIMALLISSTLLVSCS
jgi:hypothetical protein